MNPKVAKYPICGKLYETYSHLVDDQTVCPSCRAEAKKNMGKRDQYWR